MATAARSSRVDHPWLLAACILLVQAAQYCRAADMLACNTGHQEMEIPRPGWLFTWENDSVIGPYDTDEFYTQGLQLSFRMRPDRQPDWLSAAMERLCLRLTNNSGRDDSVLTGAGSFFFGQHFFTPGNITIPTLIEDDRAYAAWLYLGTRLEVAQKFRDTHKGLKGLFHTYELQIGTLGPNAQGEWVQRRWHTIVPAPDPKGWDNQLPNELGAQARYTVRASIKNWPGQERIGGWQLQGTLDGDLNLGTVLDSIGIGTTWRFGRNLGDPVALGLSPTKALDTMVRAAFDSSSYVETNLRRARYVAANQPHCIPAIALYECYVFAAISGRVVGYNAFLDGTPIHGGHSVDREPFTYDYSIGARFGWRRLQLDYSVIWASRELSVVPRTAQVRSGRHGFGAINLRCQTPIGGESHGWDLICPGLLSGLVIAIASRSEKDF